MQFIPKGSPIPHDKAPANPLNSGHQPDNWSRLCRELRHEEVSFYFFSSSTPCGDTLQGDTPGGDTPGGEALLSLAFEADSILIQPTFNQHNLRLRHPRHGQSSFKAQGLSALAISFISPWLLRQQYVIDAAVSFFMQTALS